MNQKNIVLQQFGEKERRSLSEKKDTSNEQLAPDEACVGYLPIIQRGIDYSPYYMTSGWSLNIWKFYSNIIYHFKRRMVGCLLNTVFSSSHYCNGSNEAACVLMDDKKLRMIRLDTTGGSSTMTSTTQFTKPPTPKAPPIPPRPQSPKSTIV